MKRNATRALLALCLLGAGKAGAQDIPLSKVLAPGEDWQPLTSWSFNAIGGLTADQQGLLYVSDPESRQIVRIDLEGKAGVFATVSDGVAGLAFDGEGRLYGCQPRRGRIISIESSRKERTVAEGLKGVRDLVVTRSGSIYCTVPPEQAVYLVDRDGSKREVDHGIGAPTGLVLWPDQGTLVVADGVWSHLWTFRINQDGTLSAREPYYALRVRGVGLRLPFSGADGLTVDAAGLVYATSRAGVQVFDPTGRLSGVLLKPSREPQRAVVFAGPQRDRLVLACGDKLYVRKMLTRGIK